MNLILQQLVTMLVAHFLLPQIRQILPLIKDQTDYHLYTKLSLNIQGLTDHESLFNW